MTTNTKKILTVACWLIMLLAWSMLTAYNVVDENTLLAKIIHAFIYMTGGMIGCWIFGLYNNKEKE